ncbi:MAG: hypothetical protein AAF193_06855, partial [Bacteroidota bacterium]
PKGLEISPEGKEDFSIIDKGIENNFALNKDYKYPHKKVDFYYAKHTHFLLSALPEVSQKKGFWSTTYLPFFEKILPQGHFKNMANYQVYTLNNSKLQAYLRKGGTIKKLRVFDGWFFNEWSEMNQEKMFPRVKGEEECDLIYSEAHLVLGSGELENGKFVGYTEFYSAAGSLMSAGEFNSSGEKIGEWKYYYNNGLLKEVNELSDGELDGALKYYNENGTLRSTGNVIEGNYQGKFQKHDEMGVLQYELDFKDEKPIKYVRYFPNGALSMEVPLEDGEWNGLLTQYWPNGAKYREVEFEGDVENGNATYWFINGNTMIECSYKEGEFDGDYKSFYKNGKLEKEAKYKEGLPLGKMTTYFKNGQVDTEAEYDSSGKMTGVSKEYDREGNMISEFEYKKSEMISFTHYDSDGNELASGKKKGGKLDYVGYYNDGVKRSEGVYDVGEDNRKGEWKFYDKNGKLDAVQNYNEEGQNGKSIEYHINGEKAYEANYMDGEMTGDVKRYFTHGQLKMEGQSSEDNYCGEFRSYYGDGTLKSITYYIDDERHGDQQFFDVEGNLSQIEEYEFGTMV